MFFPSPGSVPAQFKAPGKSCHPQVLDRQLPNPTVALVTTICLSAPLGAPAPWDEALPRSLPGVPGALSRCDAPARDPQVGLLVWTAAYKLGRPCMCRAACSGSAQLCSALEPAQPAVYSILPPKQTLPWASPNCTAGSVSLEPPCCLESHAAKLNLFCDGGGWGLEPSGRRRGRCGTT